MINVFFQAVCNGIEESWVKQVVETVLIQEKSSHEGTLSLIFLDDPEIQLLNRRFFSKDKPTDVIAFPLEDVEDDIWGEVYISVDRAVDQAKFYSVSPAEEIARLIIHGVLHLHDYDDLAEKESRMMSEREDFYLKKIKSAKLLV